MEKPKITYDTLINYLTGMENAADIQLMIMRKGELYKQIDMAYTNAISLDK